MQISSHSSPLVRTTKPSSSATKTKDSGICCSGQYTTLHEVWVTTDSHMSHCLVGELSLPPFPPPFPFPFPSLFPLSSPLLHTQASLLPLSAQLLLRSPLLLHDHHAITPLSLISSPL